jgi:hypothetical protein
MTDPVVSQPEPTNGKSDVQTAVLGILGAIGGGFGSVGLVAFVGASITFARFREAGVPAVSAVARVSRSELLATGADELHLAIIFSLAIALIVSWLYLRVLAPVSPKPEHPTDPKHRATNRSDLARMAILVAGGVGTVAYYWVKQDALLPIDNDQWVGFLASIVVLVAGVLAARASGRRYFLSHRSSAWALVFAFVVFLAATAIGGLGSYAKQLTHPTVRAIALSLSDGSSLTGLYIGESGAFVFIAQVDRRSSSATRGVKYRGQIVEIPEDRVTELRIGDFQPLDVAVKHADHLARELIAGAR